MKKKEEQLVRKVTDMIQKTREGKLHWDIQCQTTEYNDPAKKPVETEEGETWVIDECFVSYHCMDQEKEFLLVSYEQIYTCGEKKKSCNLIFLPPLGIRFFDVDVLAPYAVEADQMLGLRSTYAVADRAGAVQKRSTEHGTGCDRARADTAAINMNIQCV